MVAEGLWGESNGQRERHDQRRLGKTPLERPRQAWTGPQRRRFRCTKREDWLWRCSVELNLEQYWKLREDWLLRRIYSEEQSLEHCSIEQCSKEQSLEQCS